MSGSDRSWTVGPALLWFVGCLLAALWLLDGSVQAVADRFPARREPDAVPAGPAFTAKPAVVAETHEDEEPRPGPIVAASRTKILALEDACVDGTPESC